MISDYIFYKIFHLQDFIDSGLVSRTIEVELEDIGLKEIMITRGNLISILYEGVFLSLDLNDKIPFEFEDYAIYEHTDGYVYLGIDKDLYAS